MMCKEKSAPLINTTKYLHFFASNMILIASVFTTFEFIMKEHTPEKTTKNLLFLEICF